MQLQGPESAEQPKEKIRFKSYTDLLISEKRLEAIMSHMETEERIAAEKEIQSLETRKAMSSNVPTVDINGNKDMEPTYQHLKQVLAHRRSLSDKIATQLNIDHEALKQNGNSLSFIDLNSPNQKTEKDLIKIEDQITKALSGGKNDLCDKNPNRPMFGKIAEMEQTLNLLRNSVISEETSPEGHAATLARIEMVENQLALIRSKDPSGYIRSQWEIETMKRTKRSAPYKAGKMLLLGGAGLMFTLSAITTGKKIAGGEDLEFTDMLTVGYGLATLNLAGVDMSKKTELKKTTDITQRLSQNPDFVSLVEKVGPVTASKLIDEACGMLNEDNDKRKMLEKELKGKTPQVLSEEFITKFVDNDDKNILLILNDKNILGKERYAFLAKSLELRKDLEKVSVIVKEIRD
jgi:hypothetical protein